MTLKEVTCILRRIRNVFNKIAQTGKGMTAAFGSRRAGAGSLLGPPGHSVADAWAVEAWPSEFEGKFPLS